MLVNHIHIEALKEEHLPRVVDIYSYYVLNSTATFHESVPTIEEMKEILFFDNNRHKSFIIKEGDDICGYSILTRHHKREAYDDTADVTVYLKQGCIGKGVGSIAVQHLEQMAKERGFHALVAVICAENDKSITLFERNGYFKCAHYKEVGRKFGRLLDVVCYEKIIS